MMAEPQRDLTPEQAAARLRACSEVHYLDAPGADGTDREGVPAEPDAGAAGEAAAV
jgi:UDPglucose--hexose-1-phosphate uridylyltransferase